MLTQKLLVSLLVLRAIHGARVLTEEQTDHANEDKKNLSAEDLKWLQYQEEKTKKLQQSFEKYNEEMEYYAYEDLSSFYYKLDLFRNLIKIHKTSEAFPDLPKSLCHENFCENYFVEMVNFSMGYSRINELPVVLLVAGLHGDEELSIAALLNFLQTIPVAYQYNNDWYRVLNNVRFVVVPSANISGFSSQNKHERIIINNKIEQLDPKSDFNWKNNGKCFRTHTAQLLYSLQQKYLVSAALVFSGGENQILYPSKPSKGKIHDESVEKPIFEFFAKQMREISNPVGQKIGGFFRYAIKGLELVSDTNQYLMWLHGASAAPEELSTLCFSKSGDFMNRHVPVSENSNRVFAMEVSLEKTLRPRMSLGSTMGVIQKVLMGESFGSAVRAIYMIKQFSEMLRPYVKLDSTEYTAETNELKLNMNVKGCKSVTSVTFPGDARYPGQWKNISRKVNVVTSGLKTQVVYKLAEGRAPSDDPQYEDFNFGIICDHDVYQLLNGVEPVSLVGMNKRDVYQTLMLHGGRLNSLQLQDVQIYNVNIYEPKQTLSYAIGYNRVNQIHSNKLAISIGPLYPLIIEYNEEKKEVNVKMEEDWIPDQQVWNEQNKNRSLEVGVMNLKKNMLYSPELYERLQMLKKYKDALSITIFRQLGKDKAFIAPVTSEAKKPGPGPGAKDKKAPVKETVQNMKDEMKKNKTDKINSNKNTDSTNFLAKKGTSRGNSNSMSDSISRLDEIDRVVGLSLCPNVPQKVIFNYLMDFVGFKANIKVVQEVLMKQEEEVNTEGQNLLFGNNSQYLNGNLVAFNQHIMSIDSRGQFDNFTTDDQFKRLRPEKLMMLSTAGMYCSSLTSTLIKSYRFQDSFMKQLYMDPSIQKENSFFGLSVNVMFEDPSKVLMTLMVSALKPSARYWVYNKSERFELTRSKQDVDIQIESENKALKLAKYEAVLELRKVEFVGAMLKVFDESDSESVFDCFMHNYSGKNDVKEDFKIYRHTIKMLLDKRLLPHANLIQEEEQRTEVKVAGKKLLSLLGKKPASETAPEANPWDKTLVWGGLVLTFVLAIFLLWYAGVLGFLEKEFQSRGEEDEAGMDAPLEEDPRPELQRKETPPLVTSNFELDLPPQN